MKIKSLIRRANGSTVRLGEKIYRFNDENDHTCDVEDEAHIERLLSVQTFKEVAADEQRRQPKATKADGGQGDGDGEQQVKRPDEAGGEAKSARKPRQPKTPKADGGQV